MREDLQRRISAAIDSAKGLDGDPGLRDLVDADPDAAAYAHDVARLGRIMREWPLPEPDDDAFEALASRIEQRLEDAAGLSRMGDPTAPPQFDDDDDLRDATAGLLGPVVSSGEFELESIPPAAPVALAPPPPPAARPAAPPAPREIPKLVPASDNAGERFSFPSLPPPPNTASLQGGTLHALPPAPRERKSSLGWIAGLAAAAAVGLGVLATTQMASPELEAAPAAIGASAAPAVAEEVATATPAQEAPRAQPPAEGMAEPAAAPIAPEAIAGIRPEDARAAGPSATAAAARPASPALLADDLDGPSDGAQRRRAMSSGAPGGAASSGGASGGGGAARGALAEREPAPVARAQRAAPPPPPEPAAPSAPASSRAEVVEAVPDEDLPEAPERGEVLAAIQAVEPAVRACAQDQHGTASVRIVVAGSGRVTTATVSGQFAGTPVGSCVARAVRTARFPRFSSDRFEVTYPFQL